MIGRAGTPHREYVHGFVALASSTLLRKLLCSSTKRVEKRRQVSVSEGFVVGIGESIRIDGVLEMLKLQREVEDSDINCHIISTMAADKGEAANR